MQSFNEHLELPLDEFLEKNQNLARYVVNHYFRVQIEMNNFDKMELFNLALIGLMKAYQRFDPTMYKNKFSTYAITLMVGEVRRFVRDYNHNLYYSRDIKIVANKIYKYELQNEVPEKIVTKLQPVISELKVTLEKVKYALDYLENRYALSLDKAVSKQGYREDTKGIRIIDIIPFEEDFTHIQVTKDLLFLKERERQSLILDVQGYEQSEIAELFGVSQTQVSRLIKSAKEKLRAKYIEHDGLREAEPIKTRKPRTKNGILQGNREEATKLLNETTLRYNEIAKMTGVPESTVGRLAKIHRPLEVREALRKKSKLQKPKHQIINKF